MPMPPLKPATIAAQLSGYHDPASAGVVPPIQPSTTFVRTRDYAPMNDANIYARDDSDGVRLAENLLAQLEGGADALLFPSGMAAIAAVFRAMPTGATVILQTGIYWGTVKWAREFCTRRNVTLIELDCSDLDALAAASAAHDPDLIFIETPSNPWLKTTDIFGAARIAQAAEATLVVDSTAATPILQQPLALGADIVMHSATKAINGHSDVLAGALVTKSPDAPIWATIAMDRHDAGAVLNPFAAYLLTRGMRTLPLRVERMSANAMRIAQMMQADPRIDDVFYPGLPCHAGHDVAVAQMSGGYGGLLSILVKGSRENALAVAGRLDLFHRATSLGGVESMVEHRHTIEPHTGIPENLLRLSIGIEDAADLLADLDQALG